MNNEICVSVEALGIQGGEGMDGTSPQPSPQGGEGAGTSGMVMPEGGDEVEFSGKGRIVRVDGGNAYIQATEINGQPVAQSGEPEDEGAALDREMEEMSGGGGGGFASALGILLALLWLLCGSAQAKDDLAMAKHRNSSGGAVSNYVAVAFPTQATSIEIDNYSGATLYLMVFDSATNSLNGRAVQYTAVPIPTGSVGWKDWNAAGAPFHYGVNVCLSQTPYSLTNATTGGAVTVIHTGGAQ